MRLADRPGEAAGRRPDELFRSHKGDRKPTDLRERFVQVARRIMSYPAAEVARFLRVTPPAVTVANRRFDAKLRSNPHLAVILVGVLMGNI
jgi:hypothetical protein